MLIARKRPIPPTRAPVEDWTLLPLPEHATINVKQNRRDKYKTPRKCKELQKMLCFEGSEGLVRKGCDSRERGLLMTLTAQRARLGCRQKILSRLTYYLSTKKGRGEGK